MATPIQAPINPSPKQKFVSLKEWVEAHHSMIDNQPFERAANYGLMEYSRRLCEQTTDMTGAAANHFKMVGATELLHVMRTLAEPVRATTVPVSGNLIHP